MTEPTATEHLQREQREHRPRNTADPGGTVRICQMCQTLWPCSASVRIEAALVRVGEAIAALERTRDRHCDVEGYRGICDYCGGPMPCRDYEDAVAGLAALTPKEKP